jgi:transcriptional regulator NrdR family protein
MVRRRRTCRNGHRFSSWESTRFPFVRKRDDSLVEFDPQKLRTGILAATSSLPDGALGDNTAEAVASEIVEDVRQLATATPEREEDAMSTVDIGNRVLERLKDQDATGIAHWRFASVFFKDRGFGSVEELSEAVDEARTELPVWVLKARSVSPDQVGQRPSEPFSHNKLRRSLELAFTKSSRYRGVVESLLEEIIKEVRTSAERVPADDPKDRLGPRPERLEIESTRIGELVLQRLRGKPFAFARFLSVYKQYESFASYLDEISALDATGGS